MKKYIKSAFALLALFATTTVDAAAPAGYYSSCENKGGKDLLVALYSKISSHTNVGYDGLWDVYKESDVYPDGKIWDMYSTKHWNIGEKCGNYSKIGDCYNREHSMPKSWFNEASPMNSDAFHIYPTDGKVNGQRGNYPFGECANGKYVESSGSIKALGKLGASTFAGYSGTVWEPDDEYKGDFARTYFYMAACYYDRISTWKSDMLANNNYPVFSQWTINLLMKWHRQDPVSQKEKDRNDVLYQFQHNRNPFIDYPEMAEYIWGDKTSSKWNSSGSVSTTINQPVNGTSIDMGASRPGVAVEKSITVLTTAATSNVSVSITGSYFSVTPTSLTAAVANAGTTVKIKYLPTATGNHSATLTITTGSVKSVVSLKAMTVDGLPVSAPERITDESFEAVWTYIGDADVNGNYTLSLVDDAGLMPDYPKSVNAAAGRYKVDNLMPDTDYRYSLSSNSFVSEWVDVRTAMALPSIDFLFDGSLHFVTTPGEPSEVAEIMISTDNIDSGYTISVEPPFELSLDRSSWSNTIQVSPDETRMYMRLYSEVAGTFETSIKAVWGSYENDDAVVTGKVAETISFFEDFEAKGSYGSYNAQTYHGTACVWYLNDAGIWAGDPVNSGDQALRCGKNGKTTVEMAEGCDCGIGEVSFYACRWGSDAISKLSVEYSTDGGKTYQTSGEVEISATNYTKYAVQVGAPSGARLRLRQTQGKRFLIDDLSISANKTGLADANAERHRWDAYSYGGTLYVEVSAPEGLCVAIYCIDGSTLYYGELAEGTHTFSSFAPGMIYIVAVGDFSRSVLVH